MGVTSAGTLHAAVPDAALGESLTTIDHPLFRFGKDAESSKRGHSSSEPTG